MRETMGDCYTFDGGDFRMNVFVGKLNRGREVKLVGEF